MKTFEEEFRELRLWYREAGDKAMEQDDLILREGLDGHVNKMQIDYEYRMKLRGLQRKHNMPVSP